MNEELVPKRKVVKYKHMFFGFIILISGIFIGFLGGAYVVGEHFDFFRPRPQKIKAMMGQRIINDFPSLANKKQELEKILNGEFSQFGKLNDEISYRILQMQQTIAVNVSKMFTSQKEKSRWMKTFPQYFPGHKHRLNRARKYEERHHKYIKKTCILEDWDSPHHRERE